MSSGRARLWRRQSSGRKGPARTLKVIDEGGREAPERLLHCLQFRMVLGSRDSRRILGQFEKSLLQQHPGRGPVRQRVHGSEDLESGSNGLARVAPTDRKTAEEFAQGI